MSVPFPLLILLDLVIRFFINMQRVVEQDFDVRSAFQLLLKKKSFELKCFPFTIRKSFYCCCTKFHIFSPRFKLRFPDIWGLVIPSAKPMFLSRVILCLSTLQEPSGLQCCFRVMVVSHCIQKQPLLPFIIGTLHGLWCCAPLLSREFFLSL